MTGIPHKNSLFIKNFKQAFSYDKKKYKRLLETIEKMKRENEYTIRTSKTSSQN